VLVEVRGGVDEAHEEKEERFRCNVVAGAVEIGTVDQDLVDPVVGGRELVAAVVRVEEVEDIYADDGVGTWARVVEVSLYGGVSLGLF
jgi:hypothetical protein